jgi:xanthine dehydrogenase accessory factor
MRDVLDEIERWRAEGKRVAVATVVEVWGSAPRGPGSRMAVSSAGEIAGSVSGGCVEAAVVDEAGEVLESGAPRLVRYGVTNEEAWAVGLSCGGTLELFLEVAERTPVTDEAERRVREERLVALATALNGPRAGARLLIRSDGGTAGTLDDPDLEKAARTRALELMPASGTARLESGDASAFVEVLSPLPRLVVVGAGHLAIPLVALARTAGFRTVVIDPRRAFATRERFPHADEVIVRWPEEAMRDVGIHEATYVAVLAHDLKIDVPALRYAVASPARYVGVLGSRRTHAKRVEALREAGVGDEQLARIHAPIGLDLGGRRPEEIAVSIVAEMVAVTHGTRPGASGRSTATPA